MTELSGKRTRCSYIGSFKLSLLLFIENNSRVLIGQELWMKSSYPFGSCPNLRHIRHYDVIWSYIEIIRHYDVILSYIENTYMAL